MQVKQPDFRAAQPGQRNLSMECAKLIAAFLVVFAHAPFPGNIGQAISCLARCPVPLFFAISGYFSYQTSSEKLAKRLGHILLLFCAGAAVDLLWDCAVIEYGGGSSIGYLRAVIPDGKELIRWLYLTLNPYSDHLWYLGAAATCYAVLWLYVRFFDGREADYRPLYILGAVLLVINLLTGSFANAAQAPSSIFLYRNGLVFGLPVFCMGLFLRQYGQQVRRSYRLTDGKLLLIMAAGILWSLVEWFSIGLCDSMPGNILAVMALMMLLAEHPRLSRAGEGLKRLVSRFGFWSTVIYILHPVVIEVYETCLKDAVAAKLGDQEAWAAPAIIALISLTAAVLWELVFSFVKKPRKKKA